MNRPGPARTIRDHQPPPRRAAAGGLLLCLGGLILALLGWASLSLRPAAADQMVRDEPVHPIVPDTTLDPAKVALGEQLFHDPRLSADGTVSCASCHPLSSGGADDQPVSVGIRGRGQVNTLTVYNSSLNFTLFWDGRVPTLEQQIEDPLHNPAEMGSNWERVLNNLRQDPELTAQFARLYPDGIAATTVKDAIAVFERSLVTPDSPFDRWLRGDDGALTERQLEGYRLFKDYGCISCHQGVNVGGNMYGYMGTMGNYFLERGGSIESADLGRYNLTGRDEDRFLFKVPGLRLAVLTPPYFHDGRTRTIEQAIRTMARYQLGRDIPDRDMAHIVDFLGALVGHHPRLSP